MTTKVETKLRKMKIAEAPGQSDEILVIGGRDCEQNVVKFNTKTKQWSDMPVCFRFKFLGFEQGKSLYCHRHTSSCHSIVTLEKQLKANNVHLFGHDQFQP
ncbi:unnamed protein product [Clavelina lepadiformis]|uniref:Uncharacterized protein n=1 Tax=Clavelina lepadiformis TaxID=159417 RepID=A0ABP0GI81_CLALP